MRTMTRATPVRVGLALLLASLVHSAACKQKSEISAPAKAETEQLAEAPATPVQGAIKSVVATDGPFAGLPVNSHHGTIDDFAHRAKSAETFHECAPNDSEVDAIVQRALEKGIPIRVRGAGHSMHGGSLPDETELLLRTTNLRSLSFTEPGTVTVGSGVSIHGLHVFMMERGFLVPVFNGGGFGPTVGGYITAGGFGLLSGTYGGFWENVQEIELIDGNGKLVVLERSDPDFRWVFGSVGQLGVIVKAKLTILPASENETPYPLGYSRTVPQNDEEAASIEPKTPRWLTMFGPAEERPEMEAVIAEIRRRFDILDYVSPESSRYQNLGEFDFPIKFREFTPPLVNPHQGDLVAHGLWGFRKETATEEQVDELIRAYNDLVMSHPRWSRYIATEPRTPDFRFRTYWGDELYEHLLELKRKYDPRSLIDHGTVFSVDEVVGSK